MGAIPPPTPQKYEAEQVKVREYDADLAHAIDSNNQLEIDNDNLRIEIDMLKSHVCDL